MNMITGKWSSPCSFIPCSLLFCSSLLLGLQFPPSHCDVYKSSSQDELPSFLGKDMFAIESRDLSKCIAVDSGRLFLQDCGILSSNMLWKWVSNHGLFNLGSSSCLGLNVSDQHRPLRMFECDSALHTLGWKCTNDILMSADHYMVTAESGTVVASKHSYHKWKRHMSQDESFCEHHFQEIYTLRGNGLGRPCVFPFKYKNSWHHECIKEGREDGLYWCSTTMIHDQDRKWGLCPIADGGCEHLWEQNQTIQTCYQFNLHSALSWFEARVSCQAQGGDLLSITSVDEQNYISRMMGHSGVAFWIGLNQLAEASGWNWSDGAPLAMANWKSNDTYNYEEGHCGTYDGFGNRGWQSSPCTSALPYACKKYLAPRDADTFDVWKAYPTKCESGWYPYNRFCYRVVKEPLTWVKASSACQFDGSELSSVNSMADVELVLNLLQHESVSEAWIGLSTERKDPVTFHWSDGSEVTFTNWQKHQPIVQASDSTLCVSAQNPDGGWKCKQCTEKLLSICKKPGAIEAEPINSEACHKGWERHGSYCYRIDDSHRSFQEASNGYYCASPLATIANRFEQAFVNAMISNKTLAGDTYVWIGLQDQKYQGEYMWVENASHRQQVTFTHWNVHQPSRQGGCVAMQYGKSGGRWEVKDCKTFKAMSLCKKPLTAVIEEPPLSQIADEFSSVCYTWESEPHLEHCYKVFHHEKVLGKRSWQEAENFCQGFGAHLASLSNIDEEKFLTEVLSTMFHQNDERQFWIGFNKRSPSSGGSWEWSDGTPVLSSFLEDMFVDISRNCAAYTTDSKVDPLHCDAKLEWICKVRKDLIPNVPKWHLEDIPWVFFQGNDYLLFSSDFQYGSLAFACSWMGGNLLSIHSAAEQAFIESRIRKFVKTNKKWWIGLSEEEHFYGLDRWTDGSSVVYKNWETEPDDNKSLEGPLCAYISAETGLWGYSKCSAYYSAICKTSKISKIEVAQEPHPHHETYGICPSGWLRGFQKCYYVHLAEDSEEKHDWISASSYCQAHGGNLASIENVMQQAFIVMQLYGHKSSLWIQFQSKDYIKSQNGSSNAYSNWSPIMANQHKQNFSNGKPEEQECALLASNYNFHSPGTWYLENCNHKGYGFVCEKGITSDSSYTENGSDISPVPDTLEYGHKSYRILTGNISWYGAYESCQNFGGDLASITDQYHQAFLTVIANRIGQSHWIGFFSPDNGHQFEWTDGSKSLFTAWHNEESLSDGNCAYIGTDGYWRGGDCNTELQGAVCLVINETDRMDYGGECSETWIKFQNYCYSFSSVLNKTIFAAASEVCNQQGSSLLTITNEEENVFLSKELGIFTSLKMIWLNRIIFHDNGSVVWLDGTPVKFSKLVTNEHENDLPNDQCVALWTSDGTWWNSQCNEQRGFVCKKHKDYREAEMDPKATRTSHAVIPVVVVALLVLGIFLVFLWFRLKQKRHVLCSSQTFQNSYSSKTSADICEPEESILITEMGADK
ncbi:secretory phospholipase A2 receptor [Xenopus laevis]|nr:secretory phospholipase A2 receptor [Xenopus laevis]